MKRQDRLGRGRASGICGLKTFAERCSAVAIALAIAIATTTSASATVLYDNPYDESIQIGACDWNTACGTGSAISPDGFFGNDFAAQQFSLAGTATITDASATELADDNFLDAINWAFYKTDGVGGLPGTEVAGGSSFLSSNVIGFDDFGDALVEDDFSVGSVTLMPGAYYFAVQGVSADPTQVDNYLTQGVQARGAAETMDGGATWVANYASDPRSGYISSVAVSLFGDIAAVPEPSTWVMMIGGFGCVGSTMRRRKMVRGRRALA